VNFKVDWFAVLFLVLFITRTILLILWKFLFIVLGMDSVKFLWRVFKETKPSWLGQQFKSHWLALGSHPVLGDIMGGFEN